VVDPDGGSRWHLKEKFMLGDHVSIGRDKVVDGNTNPEFFSSTY
jgi:hypothetical protein